MKLLITGAQGQLGRELVRQLKKTDIAFFAASRQELDITNAAQTLQVIKEYMPDAVIQAAAYTNVDEAEKVRNEAFQINAIGTQNVAAACLKTGAKLLYVSTDYVFDGSLGRAYDEYDQTNPQGIYGRSKFAGEQITRQIVARSYIVRTSWLYGDGNNFVRTMLRLGKERDVLKVVNDQFGCPTSTVDLAEAIIALVATDAYGTYHAVNQGITTWFDFAKKIFELSGNQQIQVLPQTTAELNRPAPRPPYSPLQNNLLRVVLGHDMRNWEEALQEYIAEQETF
ncbi:MAG: dTDP-4-dehydrorhamnose reductase [Sporomusaceae bacterium]|nr:dTDP-4-dehydrorhamnose reductase [Sporomusaceae bacterium]